MISGDRTGRLPESLSSLLGDYFCLAVADGHRLFLPPKVPDLILFSAPGEGVIQASSPIVILTPDSPCFPALELPSESVLVLEGKDRHSIAYAAQRGLRVLDCGLSSRDTLTLSSFSGGDAVACLQRPVEDLLGQSVDPFEFPLRAGRQYPPFALLCCAAVLLLSGRRSGG